MTANKTHAADRCAPADSHIRSEKMKKLLLVFYSFVIAMCLLPAPVALSSDKDCNKDIEAFLNCNNPRVSKYLTRLTTKDIGKVLTGVRLTDGSIELKGYTFLGEAKDIAKGVHLYIFKFKKHRSAYIWVDEKVTEFPLPICPESVSFESAYVLSGDVYTWKDLQPGHGIVHSMCIDDLWMKKIK